MPPENRRTLRCLKGEYAGQLVEYPEHVARLMLAWGVAEEPTPGNGVSEPEVAILPEPEWRDA